MFSKIYINTFKNKTNFINVSDYSIFKSIVKICLFYITMAEDFFC